MSEILFLSMVLFLSAQNSLLWSSLILIPLSISVILISSSVNIFSGVIMVIYFMVFIGGLLVLLVSVASLSFIEQSSNLSKIVLLVSAISFFPFLLEDKLVFFKGGPMNTMSIWLEFQLGLAILLVFLVMLALSSMTNLILTFKGVIRST